ncbi:dipeptidase PepE [Aliikangiella sp. G2MR2-5]|uniref:dipeptidase PepE n=1 Tax=Aliikangiella sp. G2MR2-5 TaxID=2788943 RepID=UPI0018A96991|nr:dipeptidase PepE [Aliikangiella sp. G2MR2-5]
MNLLLLSSSRVDQTEYLEHARQLIQDHLKQSVKKALFIPFAGVSVDYDSYEKMVSNAFNSFGYQVKSTHHYEEPVKAIKDAEAILVGGGNTFALLNQLYSQNLVSTIQRKINEGTPYIGWSAGSNIASPTIKTTNDMPIIEPPSFNALNLVPFQINPHYIDGNPPGHNGETREQRLFEFLQLNQKTTVIGIPEGTALKCDGRQLEFLGHKNGFCFTYAEGKIEIPPGTDLSALMNLSEN